MAERRPFYPGRTNNGRPPPERGGIRFAVTTEPRRPETRTPTIPTRETPPLPVQDQIISQALKEALGDSGDVFEQPRKTKNNRARVLISRGILALMALTGVGIGIKVLANNEPTPQTSSADFPNSPTDNRLVPRAEAETKKVNPEEVFDNKARSGEIGVIKRIPEEETSRLDSFAKINDHNTVLAIHPIDVSTSNKPDAKIKFTKRNTGSGNDQDRINRAEQGFLNIFYFDNVPEGSTILAPIDGNLIVFMNPNPRKDATNDHPFFQAMIAFQPREGEEFRVGIRGRSVEGGMMNKRGDVFRSLTNAPVYDAKRPEVLKQAIPVKKGDPILQAAMDIDVSFSMGGNIDLSKVKGTTTVNGKEVNLLQEDPVNLELFLEDGVIIQPQPTN